MGIGRSEFIKLTSLTLAGISINPFQALITHDNLYIHKKLGILFYKPDFWEFIHVMDFGKLKDEQILGNRIDIIKDKIFEDIGYPICLMSKYNPNTKRHIGIFSPTITVNINPEREIAAYGSTKLKHVIKKSEKFLSLIRKDFKVISRFLEFNKHQSKSQNQTADLNFQRLKNSIKLIYF